MHRAAQMLAMMQGIFERWIASAASAVEELIESFRSRKEVFLVENEDGSFVPTATSDHGGNVSAERPDPARIMDSVRGCRVSVCLRRDRFVFRQIEVPSQASDFLEGVVRSRLEVVMPFDPSTAVYGWKKVKSLDGKHVEVAVAGCAAEAIAPIANGFVSAKVHALQLRVIDPESDLAIPVWNERIAPAANRKLQRGLGAAIAGMSALAMLLGAAVVVLSTMDGERQELAAKVARLKAGSLGAQQHLVRELVLRKQKAPLVVITIEELSKMLPDDTFLTEVRFENGKVWLTGFAKEAASLLVLLEKSERFSGATFFVPTTRNAQRGREQFHIEAQLKPPPQGHI